MTGNDNAAGDQPGGASDGRSTALVGRNIPCRCGNVRRCHFPACLEPAANVDPITDRAYCEVHSADVLPRRVWAWLVGNYAVEHWGSGVGQYVFRFHLANHSRRDVIRATYAVSESTYRCGQVVCDRCAVEDFGVEFDLCRNCLRSAILAGAERDEFLDAYEVERDAYLTERDAYLLSRPMPTEQEFEEWKTALLKFEEWKTALLERWDAMGRLPERLKRGKPGSAGAK